MTLESFLLAFSLTVAAWAVGDAGGRLQLLVTARRRRFAESQAIYEANVRGLMHRQAEESEMVRDARERLALARKVRGLHGSDEGYTHGCRCSDCVEARRNYRPGDVVIVNDAGGVVRVDPPSRRPPRGASGESLVQAWEREAYCHRKDPTWKRLKTMGYINNYWT